MWFVRQAAKLSSQSINRLETWSLVLRVEPGSLMFSGVVISFPIFHLDNNLSEPQPLQNSAISYTFALDL